MQAEKKGNPYTPRSVKFGYKHIPPHQRQRPEPTQNELDIDFLRHFGRPLSARPPEIGEAQHPPTGAAPPPEPNTPQPTIGDAGDAPDPETHTANQRKDTAEAEHKRQQEWREWEKEQERNRKARQQQEQRRARERRKNRSDIVEHFYDE